MTSDTCTKKLIIHLSDLHYRDNWEEDQGLVLDCFFKDVAKQIKGINPKNIYLAFSGDIVQAGSRADLYQNFRNQFHSELDKLNIPKSQRICVPGNHDISTIYVKEKFYEHESCVAMSWDERQFNDYVSKPGCIFEEKFKIYRDFESAFADYGIGGNFSGKGWNLDANIGIYCLNSSICASGGVNNVKDENRLSVDTRSLQKWLLECTAAIRILIMHHPVAWLTDWAQVELRRFLRKDFSLLLSGHVHDQSVFHSISKESSLIECSAPPLLTNKKEKLGYSMVSVGATGVTDIQYRQWTLRRSFVSGVDFSDTDDGKVVISQETAPGRNTDSISELLDERLTTALRSFSGQPVFWVEPVLSWTSEISRRADDNSERSANLEDIAANPKSLLIKAPPQFGLTCLAHYLIKEAWTKHSSRWLFLDAKNIKPLAPEKAVRKALDSEHLAPGDLHCVILDSWTDRESSSLKLVQGLSELFPNIPIIVMQTIDDISFSYSDRSTDIGRPYEVLHLLALPRGRIRKVVSTYNKHRPIGDDDAVLQKVVTDLETLNIHRTPLNCITLLKVSEKHFDESPINRTKMLEMVLFLLFNTDSIPTYKSRPDVKDCEYVLGRFCEKLLRSERYEFSRQEFTKELAAFCEEKLIDLEIDLVFSILYENSIIVKWDGDYKFRFKYWLLYFSAQRMHSDATFADYIFSQKKYVSYPEIMEFYTGIDRSRDNALQILIGDLRIACDTVLSKVGLPNNMNPYRQAQWAPSLDSLTKMRDEISNSVMNSKLPTSVKDRFLDSSYDQHRPYDQTIHRVAEEYSLAILWQNIRASARALRNSDYASPGLKRELLSEIMRCKELLTNVLVVLVPALATNGYATIEGKAFILDSSFSGITLKEKIAQIWAAVPQNIVRYFKDDLFSNKMGPLLFDLIENTKNELEKHELILLLIYERPREWHGHVRKYIESVRGNSFYLYDVICALRREYRYSFVSPPELSQITYLIKTIIAKNQLGYNKPGPQHIKNISNKALPQRENEEDQN